MYFREGKVTDALIYANVLMFLLQLIMPGLTEAFYFDPSKALAEPWRFITSMFLHGGIGHIFFNMYALWLFGSIVERRVGSLEFLKLYFLAGIFGNITYLLAVYSGIYPNVPALGASGAVYGVLGAASVLYPNLVVFVWWVPMRLYQAAVLWFVLEFLGIFNPYSGIASAAHVGGLILGILYAKKWRDRFLRSYFGW